MDHGTRLLLEPAKDLPPQPCAAEEPVLVPLLIGGEELEWVEHLDPLALLCRPQQLVGERAEEVIEITLQVLEVPVLRAALVLDAPQARGHTLQVDRHDAVASARERLTHAVVVEAVAADQDVPCGES